MVWECDCCGKQYNAEDETYVEYCGEKYCWSCFCEMNEPENNEEKEQ